MRLYSTTLKAVTVFCAMSFVSFASIALCGAAAAQIPLVTLDAAPKSLTEGGLATSTITATLSGAPVDGVTVTLQAAGTADAADFELSSTTIVIPFNATTGSVTLSVVDDGFVEGLEVVRIEVATVSGALEDGDQEVEIEILDDDLVLPVELSAFRVVRNGRELIATWQTESESGNAGFFVELSPDRINFRDVGWVEGSGTTNSPRIYTHAFSTPSSATRAYIRLRQVDSDGSLHFSSIVEVAGALHSLELYPNPARERATIVIPSSQGRSVTVTIFDLLGREVKQLHVGDMDADETRSIDFSVADLASGIYLVRADNGVAASVRKLRVSN